MDEETVGEITKRTPREYTLQVKKGNPSRVADVEILGGWERDFNHVYLLEDTTSERRLIVNYRGLKPLSVRVHKGA